MLRIAATEYNAERQCLEVYVLGCNRFCPGCHNAELWPYGGKGRRWPEWLRRNRYKLKTDPIKEVWILGGDLLCQHDQCDMIEFVRSLHNAKPKDATLWLWTGGEINDVPANVLSCLDYVKTGTYQKDLPSRDIWLGPADCEPIILASSNQEIWRIDKRSLSYEPCSAEGQTEYHFG